MVTTAERNRRYRLRHPEKIRAWKRAYYQRHKARIQQKNRDYYARNRSAVKDRAKARYNPEAEKRRAWRRAGLPQPTRAKPKLCECCGAKPHSRKGLALDHCHKTNKFRGWLCHRCNLAIGALGDSVAGLMRAVRYMRRSK